ncbi:hypothetical protein [Virgibacillus necropolis]|uniref:hypothetical protein n=1 Tax=Virgibacillus necropolis TaxID=163877 RepID=UPI00137472C9|nr:hypothetical protein [Virgibacillus necropolis]
MIRKLDRDFLQVSVVEGSTTVVVDEASLDVIKGINFILPYTVKKYQIFGVANFVVSHI